jgi:formiminotetrahydrofolate cyclodeaminase
MSDTGMSITLREQTLGGFLDVLASRAPTPGGGSVAALTGAQAAALLSMVCAISIERKKNGKQGNDNGAQEELRSVQSQAEQLRQELQDLAEADIEVFENLSAAYKLPRTTDADAATRQAAIQKLTQRATDVPLHIAHAAVALLPLCERVVGHCGRLIVSDVGVAVLLAQATVQSALLSVEINLSNLSDRIYTTRVRTQVEDLSVGLDEQVADILKTVYTSIRQ